MPGPRPLDRDEEAAWRQLARLLVTAPRVLESDLSRATGLTMPEYFVLMRLSDAPDGELGLTDLSGLLGLSPSRVTRLVDQLAGNGWVAKNRLPADGRATVVRLTDPGAQRLREAYPAHLASVRRRVVDVLTPAELQVFARAVAKINAAGSGPPGTACC